MKHHRIKNETGAIMIEILAVLALIGVMGPMLFRQVISRNQEISNVNMASEMRTIKEAVSAYIAADGAALGAKCLGSTGTVSDVKLCPAISEADLLPFLPAGMEDIMQYYTVESYGYWVDYGTTGKSDLRPFIYAMVVSKGDGQPQEWNFRRAARVASLIGADGGVVVGGNYTGTSGSWELPLLGAGVQDDSVVATTAFDTFEPDLGIVSPNAVYAPESLAFKRLHAWNYFSVGDKDAKESGHCFRQIRTMDADKALPDEIYNVGITVDGAACDPLFWVGASGAGNDKSQDGNVYAKKNVYVGRNNTDDTAAIGLETQDEGIVGDAANAARRVVVYDIDGTEKITIDAKGRIIADKSKTMALPGAEASSVRSYYGLDPANTSVLNDIRLGARGGARLSDILPNYIAKNAFILTNGQVIADMLNSGTSYSERCTNGTFSKKLTIQSVPASCSVPKPTCPGGYETAIMLTPRKWGNSIVENIYVPGTLISTRGMNEGQHNLTVLGSTVQGEIRTYPIEMTKTAPSGQLVGVRQSRKNFILSVSAENANYFTVDMGYNDSKSVPDGASTTVPTGELQAVAQTFCVYQPSTAPVIPPDTLLNNQP